MSEQNEEEQKYNLLQKEMYREKDFLKKNKRYLRHNKFREISRHNYSPKK